MKKILLFLILAIFTVTLLGCDDEKDYTIYDGMVVDKIFCPGYTRTIYVKSGHVMIPMTSNVPDKYYIVIYNDEQIAKHQVSKSFYENFEIGSFVVVGETDIEE